MLVPLTVVDGPVGDEGEVSIQNTVYGNCGYAWTYLFDTGGNDNKGLIDYGAHSTLGNIVRVSWETHLHQGYFGTLLLFWSGTDWRWPWEGATWSKSYEFDISPWGDGWYSADLWYLDVWTVLGYHCVGLWPFDYWYISQVKMREVVEAALTRQRQLDEGLRERTGGEAPYVSPQSTAVVGVLQAGPRSWLVALVREVEVPYLTPKERVEFITWRVDRDDAGYRAIERTSMTAAKTPLSPLLTTLTWWALCLKCFLRSRRSR